MACEKAKDRADNCRKANICVEVSGTERGQMLAKEGKIVKNLIHRLK